MHKSIRISALALTLASFSLAVAMPLAAGWGVPAERSGGTVSIDPFQLMQRATDLPNQQIEDFSMIY
jgi:hypothetical protein